MPVSLASCENDIRTILATLEDVEEALGRLLLETEDDAISDIGIHSVIEDVERILIGIEANSQTTAEANMGARRAAWYEAELAWAHANIRHETACEYHQAAQITDALMNVENELWRKAEDAYRLAFEDAEKAGFLTED